MIETYIILSMLAGSPKFDSFRDIQNACAEYEAVSGKGEVHIYKATLDKNDLVILSEGFCKPVKQFLPVK